MSDLSAKPEKNYRAKTKQADSQSGYLGDKIVGSTYINVTEEDGSVGKRLKLEVDSSALGTAIDSGKVLVSSRDTTKNYLFSKLEEGNAITLSIQNGGGDEIIKIDASYTEGDGIDITDDEISLDADLDDLNDVNSPTPSNGDLLRYDNASGKWVDDYTLEGTFTGTASKVPSSSAIKTKLQALYLTDADNLGSTGNSIMNEVKDIEPSRILCVSESDATASNIIDTSYPKTSTMIAVTPVVGDNGDGGFQSFGGFTIQTNESPAMDNPNYTAGLVRFTLDEYYSSATPLGVEDSIYLDLMLRLPANGVALNEMKVKISPYYIKDGTADFATFYAPQTKTIQWDGTGADVCNWYTWTFSGMTASTKPIPLAFFITIQSEDGAFTATYTGVNTVEIVALRARYKKPVIGLNGSSVVI